METSVPSTYEEERGKPMPSKLHSLAQTNLLAAFLAYRPQFQVLSELTIQIGDRDMTPDLVLYRDLSIDLSMDEVRVAELPLIAIEIASPTQGIQSLKDKIEDMMDHGVPSCWLVVPLLRTITVFSEGMHFTTYAEGTVTDPATDIEVDLDAVFALPGGGDS